MQIEQKRSRLRMSILRTRARDAVPCDAYCQIVLTEHLIFIIINTNKNGNRGVDYENPQHTAWRLCNNEQPEEQFMYKCEREQEILLVLKECHYVTVEFLAQKLHISASSIRRDLKQMENHGLVKRSYGGVELLTSASRIIPFSMRSHENLLGKKRIAKQAASLLKSGDSLFLDGSSTSFYMIDSIASIKNITVATNSIDGIRKLAEYDLHAYCTGGAVSGENRAVLSGGFAEDTLRGLHMDFVFLSAQAVSPEGDIYDCYESEIPLRRRMLENADKRVFLADSSKFNSRSLFYLDNLQSMDYVISDMELDKAFTDRFPQTTFLVAK